MLRVEEVRRRKVVGAMSRERMYKVDVEVRDCDTKRASCVVMCGVRCVLKRSKLRVVPEDPKTRSCFEIPPLGHLPPVTRDATYVQP